MSIELEAKIIHLAFTSLRLNLRLGQGGNLLSSSVQISFTLIVALLAIVGYRVEEVKRRLKSGNLATLTILGIALESGCLTDHSLLLPDRLRNVLSGIVIIHDPTPVWPELNADTVNFPGKYIWKHSSRVKSLNGDLQVISVKNEFDLAISLVCKPGR